MTPTEALAKHGLTIKAEFVPFSQSRNKAEKHFSLNWRVTLQHKGRAVMTTDYSAGAAHCPSYKHAKPYGMAETIQKECEIGFPCRFNEANDIAVRRLNAQPILPKPEDVIHSLLMDGGAIENDSFEEWARDCGYDPDSRKGEAIYRACVDIGLKLRNAVGDAGLTELREAFQNY